MTSVLITAFEPYDRWPENASWLTLIELTKSLPSNPKVTTRRYPVDFQTVRTKLAEDLAANYDYAIHLGQAPGAAGVQLEAIGINVGREMNGSPGQCSPLVVNGPVAYQSTLPLAAWASELCKQGIPAKVSHHAGTYLCNAALYLSLHTIQEQRLKTQAAFIHLPLDVTQASAEDRDIASMPAATSSQALRLLLDQLA